MARTIAMGLRREPQPPIPIVMPSRSSPTISSIVTRLSGVTHDLVGTDLTVRQKRAQRRLPPPTGATCADKGTPRLPSAEREAPVPLPGRVVVVTGGCRGVGSGIAARFLEAGAEVVVCCRHEPESLPRAGARSASFVAADVRDPDAIDAVIAAPLERHRRLDTLVHNAGR